ncbi:MAG: hypothetical protein JWO84_487 [Parcubacteria group bacterium]|nr:hypothetical protein [Parcubacteria group bacterium]
MRALLLAGEFAALGAASVILLVFLASSLDGLLVRSGQGAAVITSMLVDLANTDRGVNHVGELTISPTLTSIAQAKANDMAARGYFAHVSPEGHDPWYWFTQGGYLFSYAGENLAVDFSDSADVEQAWMNSPTHRANLLNGHFTEIGIATAVGTYQGHQTTFVVQEFGTPAHATQTAAITNVTSPTAPTDIALATTITPSPRPVARPLAIARATTTTGSATATPAIIQPAAPHATEVLGAAATGLSNPPAPQQLGLTALWNVFAASPKTTLRYAYYLFGLLILIALVIETGIELRRHHMKHVFLAISLLVLMSGLFMAANAFVFTNPIIADTGATVSGT